MNSAWGNIRSPKIIKSFKLLSLPSVDIVRIFAKICFLLPLSNFGWELNFLRCCIMHYTLFVTFCVFVCENVGLLGLGCLASFNFTLFLRVLFPVSISLPPHKHELHDLFCVYQCGPHFSLWPLGRSRRPSTLSTGSQPLRSFWNALTDAINSTGCLLLNFLILHLIDWLITVFHIFL